MSSHGQSSGWITASKSSNASSLKSQRVAPKLYQSSLHDFIKRKPKTNHAQKENRSLREMSRSNKRKQDDNGGCNEDVVKKKQRSHEAASQRPKGILIDDPSRRSNGLGDKRLKSHVPLPPVVPVGQDISWEGTTVWDSATSSRTLRVEPSVSLPCSPMETTEVTKRVSTWTRDVSGPFKAPAAAAQASYGRILAPDTPARINHFNFVEDPFFPSPTRNDAPKPTRNMEVIPSSQSQDVEFFSAHTLNFNFLASSSQTLDMHFTLPSHSGDVNTASRIHHQLGIISDEFVPSSQSQPLLQYRTSPFRPALRTGRDSDSATVCVDIVPSSQSLEELELKLPFPYHRGSSRTRANEQRNFSVALAPVISPSSLGQEHTPNTPNIPTLTPRRNPAPPSPSLSIITHIASAVQDPPSPSRHAETFTSAVISTSPPPLAASQYSYLSSDASYPPEVKNFLSMFDEDRRSLGSDFHGTSLGQSLVFETPRDIESHGVTDPSRSTPSLEPRTSSPEPSESCLTQDPISTQRILEDHGTGYTFLEESCPPVVTNFLDMLDEDRSSLGSQFQQPL